MKNVLHKQGWNSGTNPSHVEPLLIPLIMETYIGKSEEYFIKLKLRTGPTSSTSDLLKFKIYFFNHGDTEEFLLFIRNLNMTLLVIAGTGDGRKDSVSLYTSPWGSVASV